jgi:hypothetical protein
MYKLNPTDLWDKGKKLAVASATQIKGGHFETVAVINVTILK